VITIEANYNNDLIPYLYEGVYVVDQKRKIIFWNEGSERITGYKASEVMSHFCYQNILQHIDINGKQLCLEGCPLHDTLKTGRINEAHVFLRHKDGFRVPVMVKSLPIYDDQQQIVAAIEVFTDERFQRAIYDENIQLKDKLKFDPLTKVANRHFFDFQIAKRIEEACLFNRVFGLLMIDIDHFKTVNDTYGHLVGDEILKIVASSLAANVGSRDTVTRWGGEEFAILIEVDDQESLLNIAEKLRHVIMSSSYQTEATSNITVTVSIGGTLYRKGEDVNTFIGRADQKMYEAKRMGRNQSNISN
jgi:two-component system, cell cycle response regulator